MMTTRDVLLPVSVLFFFIRDSQAGRKKRRSNALASMSRSLSEGCQKAVKRFMLYTKRLAGYRDVGEKTRL